MSIHDISTTKCINKLYSGQDKIRGFCHIDTTGSPGGTTSSGSSTDDDVHDGSFLKVMVVSVPSTSFDTLTFPGKELEK